MKLTIATVLLALTSSAFALMGFLESEETPVGGNVKYCKYSNGVILTVQSYKLCPLSVD